MTGKVVLDSDLRTQPRRMGSVVQELIGKIRIEDTRLRIVPPLQIHVMTELLLDGGIIDRTHHLDPAVEVSRQEIRRGDESLWISAIMKDENPGVLQQSINDPDGADVLSSWEFS